MRKLLLGVFALALAGCVDLSSPKGAVESLGFTIAKNNYKGYKEILMGNAEAQYGSRQVFDELRAQANDFKNAKVGKSKLLSKSQKRNGDVHLKYSVPVNLGGRVAEATVYCVHTWGYRAVWPEDVMAGEFARNYRFSDFPYPSRNYYPGDRYPYPPDGRYPYPEPPPPKQIRTCQIAKISGL